MVEQAVKEGAGQSAVVIEKEGPFFEGAVGGEDEGTTFVTVAEDLEEEVGAVVVDGEIAEFVKTEKIGGGVFFQGGGETLGTMSGGQGVDDLDGGGEEDGIAFLTSVMAQGGGEMGFAEADTAEEDDVGVGLDKVEAKEGEDELAVDFLRMFPAVLFEGFEDGKAGVFKAVFEAFLEVVSDFVGEEGVEEVVIGEVLFESVGEEVGMVFLEMVEAEIMEAFFAGDRDGFHGVFSFHFRV